MIRIHVVRDKKGFICEFTVKGHAGFRVQGSDIICSAVSAIAYTAVGALEGLAGISGCCEEEGYMKCSIPTDISDETADKVQIILETTVIGFKQIEFSYRKYVTVFDEEV